MDTADPCSSPSNLPAKCPQMTDLHMQPALKRANSVRDASGDSSTATAAFVFLAQQGGLKEIYAAVAGVRQIATWH